MTSPFYFHPFRFSLLIISVILDVVRENMPHLFRPLIPAIPHLLYPMKRVRKVSRVCLSPKDFFRARVNVCFVESLRVKSEKNAISINICIKVTPNQTLNVLMYLQKIYNKLGSHPPPSHVASIYSVLSIALGRILAVCRPHQYREMQVQSNQRLLL